MIRLLLLTCITLLGACSKDQAPQIHELAAIGAPGSAQANLSAAVDGTVILSWLEPFDDGVALRYSTLREASWSEPITVSTGDELFVNWADFPSVVKIDGHVWAAHWLTKRPGGTFAYDIAISISQDGGRTWGEAITPHTDETATEHGFVSLFPWQGGVGALWLDGRNMVGHGDGGMTLRSVVLDGHGKLISEQLADELVCDCCQTDVAIGASGPVAVYRNRTEAEIRDIYVMRAVDGSWQSGEPIADDGWEIAGCPVNGPAIASSGRNVAIAWFTAANGKPTVRFARSSDGANTFDNALDIATGRVTGRVGVAIFDDGSAAVSWLRPAAGGKGEILLRNISPRNDAEPELFVATTESGRTSGFPQLVRNGDRLVLAWTDALGEQSQIRSAVIGDRATAGTSPE